MFMDYEFDSDGQVRLIRVPVWEIGWDPASIEPNLMDARHVIRDRWIDEDEIIQRFGRELVNDVKAYASVDAPGRSRGFMSRYFSRQTDDPRDTYFNARTQKFYDPKRRKVRLIRAEGSFVDSRSRLYRPGDRVGGSDGNRRKTAGS